MRHHCDSNQPLFMGPGRSLPRLLRPKDPTLRRSIYRLSCWTLHSGVLLEIEHHIQARASGPISIGGPIRGLILRTLLLKLVNVLLVHSARFLLRVTLVFATLESRTCLFRCIIVQFFRTGIRKVPERCIIIETVQFIRLLLSPSQSSGPCQRSTWSFSHL